MYARKRRSSVKFRKAPLYRKRSFSRRKRSMKKKMPYRKKKVNNNRSIAKKIGGRISRYMATQSIERAIQRTTAILSTSVNMQNIFFDQCVVGGPGDYNYINSLTPSYKDYFIKQQVLTACLINQDVKPTYVSMYYWTARNDLPLNMNYNTIGGFLQYASSMIDNGATTNYQTLGWTPFSTSYFGHYFKVYKVRRILLTPGVEKRITLKSPSYYRLDKAVDDYANTVTTRGLTRGIGFIVQGSVVNDSVNLTNVGTGAVKIDMVIVKKTSYSTAPNNHYWSTSSSLGTITTEQFINAETGLKQTGDVQA